jgi:hypothetical protein
VSAAVSSNAIIYSYGIVAILFQSKSQFRQFWNAGRSVVHNIRMAPMTIALLLAIPLILAGLGSGLAQLRNRAALAVRKHVPSDELAYFTTRYRRRLLAAAIMTLIGVLIAGAYLGGLEASADSLAAPNADGTRKIMTDDNRQFIRLYALFWSVVIILAFGLVAVAMTDAWATRRYALRMYRHLREDHHERLRRDLAVYLQDRDQRRGRGGWAGRGAAEAPTPPDGAL